MMWLTLLFLVLSLPLYANFLSTEGDEEEKISEEAKRLESRFGPQYHNTALQHYSEEQPFNVSDNADLIQGNTAEETSKEDVKETAIFAASIALAICLIFLVCFCVAFRKCRMQKGNTCHTFGRSSEQPKSVEGRMNADGSHGKSLNSETLPLLNSVDELRTALTPNSRSSLTEDSN